MTKYYLKEHVTDKMLEAVGFVKYINGDMYRKTSRGEIVFYRCKRILNKIMYDSSTEYRRDVKIHIKDLIQLGYVEARK